MRDLQTVVLAAAIWLGCVVALPVPALIGVSLAVVAFALRSPRLLIIAGLALGLSAGHRADVAYQPIPPGSFSGEVTLVSLPEVQTFSERAVVKLPTGERVQMTVSPSAGSIRTALPGAVLGVAGSVKPIEPSQWDRSRHVVGRLSASSVVWLDGGAVHWRLAATVQHAVDRSTAGMSERHAALYDGLVTGDDREQGAAQRATFRRVGLSHILAVSGQNVAFLLVIAHLGVGSLPGWARVPAIGLILLIFALVTQLEPSVLRATVTAAGAYWAVVTGRAGSGARMLSLAVGVLLLVDPFLALALSFQLSVLASAGILLLGPALASRCPGPSFVRLPLAVTMAAQLGVAPLLILSFGGVSPISVPANLLVGWAAAAVMMWGMSVGLVAGLLGESMAATLQLPVRLLLGWIDGVARWSATLPAPQIGRRELVAFVVIGAVASLLPKRLRVIGVILGAALVLLPGVTAEAPAYQELDGGHLLAGPEGSILILDPNVTDRIVADVLEARPDRVVLVVVTGGNRSVSEVVRELDLIVDVDDVIAPPQHRVVDARRLLTDVSISSDVGPVRVIVASDNRLEVQLPLLDSSVGVTGEPTL